MQANERRDAILKALKEAEQPLSAGRLAAALGVSRQIIVGDVALLRAAGEDISATPRGYVCNSPAAAGIIRQIVCRHNSADMEKELDIIVDNGCTVVDVIVDHPVYGELRGPLQISSRYDVSQFIEKVWNSDAQPLSLLTDGLHLHTIACPDPASFDRVRNQLRACGFLVENTEG